MPKHRYTIAQAEEAVKSSPSVRQVLIKLGLSPQGGNYKTIKDLIHLHNWNTEHFLGQGHNRGKDRDSGYVGNLVPLEDYLENLREIQSYKLKRRLLNEGHKDAECENCGITSWQGEDAPLELHHIDGNSRNNRLVNLQILCPNCHALTSNYRGKGIG